MSAITLLSFVACNGGTEAPAPEPAATEARFIWSRSWSGTTEQDEIDALASAPDGSIYSSGKFEGTLEIQGLDDPLVSRGAADVPVVRYAPDGSIDWVLHWGASGEDNVFDATTDAAGNLYLSGYFADTLDLGGDFVLSTTDPDDLDMMVISLTPDGEVRWATQAGGSGTDGGNEIAIAPDGSVVVLAGSDGPMAAGSLSFAPSQGRDAFVLRLNGETGAIEWGAQIGGPGEVRAKCLTVGADGTVYAGGDQGLGTNQVLVGDAVMELPAARQSDAFLVAFTDGELAWSKSWGGAGRDLCKGVVATDGALFITGEIEGVVDFENGEEVSTDGPDLFLARLDVDGSTTWVRRVSAPDDLRGAEVVAHPDGGVVFGHRIYGPTLFESTGGDVEIIPDEPGPVLVSYDRDGELRFAIQPVAAPDANIDELAISGRQLSLDMPIFEGTYQVGIDSHLSGPTKDALVVRVDL